MIKGKSPYPFETIGLGISFTPALPFLIAEMKRICQIYDALAVFIHVGKKTSEKQRELAQMLGDYGFHDGNSRIHWEQGDAVTGILLNCKMEVVDLLLIGSNEKASLGIPIGSTASQVAKKAKCSVLIYSRIPQGGFKKIILNGTEHQKTDLTILTGMYVTDKESAEDVTVIADEGNNKLSEAISHSHGETQSGTILFQQSIEKARAKMKFVNLENKQSISEFSFRNNADLVVTRSSDHALLIFDRISGSDGIDSLLTGLPANLLIVHSRLSD